MGFQANDGRAAAQRRFLLQLGQRGFATVELGREGVIAGLLRIEAHRDDQVVPRHIGSLQTLEAAQIGFNGQ